MHPSKVIKDPKINDTYYDPDVDKLYQYVKIGDFPPEWVVTNIDETLTTCTAILNTIDSRSKIRGN